MTTFESQSANAGNMVDRASSVADRLLESTRQSAESALGSVADTVHSVRDRASPVLDRWLAPVDSLVARTQAAPLKSLLLAVAVGATLMAVSGLFRATRRG